jgi:ribosomal protein S18 acetylase RimI-like enzyme
MGENGATGRKETSMIIRAARPDDAAHLVRFINMAADDLPLHFWRKSVGPGGDALAYGRERAARDSGSFSSRNAWLAEAAGEVAGCLLGYPADPAPSAIDPDTPPLFVPLLELEALAPGSWYLNVLATDPAHRGRGIGTALLAHADSVARQAGHGSISLIAEDSHQDARRLYIAKGFVEVARRPVVREDWQVDAQDWILYTRPVAA